MSSNPNPGGTIIGYQPIFLAEVGKRIQREKDSAMTVRSENPLDYTTFGELGEIIKQNWIAFGSIFESQRAVEKVMNTLNMIRGPIAHCSPLSEDEECCV